jgi:hypothetical protein
MFEPSDFVRSVRSRQSGVVAATIIGDVRIELDQFVSLIEVAIAEAESATSLDAPERKRAFNVVRALRDLISVNSIRLGRAERLLASRGRRASDRPGEAAPHPMEGQF